MNEELVNSTTEETIEINVEDVVESEIQTEDVEQNVQIEETIETVEVEMVEEIEITVDEAVGWVGGDTTRHYSLYGREEPDQHPIAAITGLREELNDIEALDVVYSNERNQANYYLWEDENPLHENRVGYFISICPGIEKIKLCDSDNVIFGVSVDNAGFVGAQNDIVRDYKYGLIVTSGVVRVKCESDVVIGDYVVSNNYGYATKNKSGYKVVGVHDIEGVEYAEIILVTPISRICNLTDEVDDLSERMNDAETNIVAAMNVSNAAYNKAGEVGEVSQEAIKNALEALNKSNETSERTDNIESNVSSANEIAVQAKAIAESAVTSAETIRNEAVKTSNEALAGVNDLVEDLKPITTWNDPDSGNTGAEYLTTYIKEGLATKIEVQTIEKLTEENKSAIEKNAEGIQTMVSSVDKYSVGEYSQAYGLTREQAVSILTEGMVYIPTKHIDSDSHSETFTDESEPQWFTPHNYYVWDGNDWIEHGNSVAFFSEIPIPSNTLKYWYIDSNEAPEGYEPYTLYIWDEDKSEWKQVNILAGNANNRITSMIRQTADEVALEVTNARGSATTLSERLTNTEAEISSTASWVKGTTVDGDKLYNIATIDQSADNSGSSLSLVVADKDGNKILNGASIVLGQGENDSYISVAADNITLTGKQINIGTDGVSIDASDGELAISSNYFSVDTEGKITATGGQIGTWTLAPSLSDSSEYVLYGEGTGMGATTYTTDPAFWAGFEGEEGAQTPWQQKGWADYCNFFVRNNGEMVAKYGEIAGWKINPTLMYKDRIFEGDNKTYRCYMQVGGNSASLTTSVFGIRILNSNGTVHSNPFDVKFNGEMHATKGDMGGWTIGDTTIQKYANGYRSGMASTGALGSAAFYAGVPNESGSVIGQANFYVTHGGKLYTKDIEAVSGTIGGCKISNSTMEAGSTFTATNGAQIGNWQVYGNNLYAPNYTCGNGTVQSTTLSNEGISCSYTYNNQSYTMEPPWYVIAECGIWYADMYLTGQSDANIKNSIEELSIDYEILFDNLKPKKYKYNEGTSDRYHTGFIAQEVEEAILSADLTTQDFAGLMRHKIPDRYNSIYSLRKDEFVALNTWQIQKAKARITELENRVAELEKLINKE